MELREAQARSNEQITQLESALATLSAAPSVASPASPSTAFAPTGSPVASRLAISGDVRVRYETNFGDNDGRNRGREVVRARLRASYAITDGLTAGAQIATGDPDDPNSADVSLSGFADDLAVSLDQAYLRYRSGNLDVLVGKFPQPLMRTELVWDGDVSPQGLAGSYRQALGDNIALRGTGIYFMVDESVAGPDSTMIGGQAGLEAMLAPTLKAELAAGYYDYRLRSLSGADTGDIRGNRFAGGQYLSDFNLLDVIGAISWAGLADAWPVRVVGDYVKNFGAGASGDDGFGVDILVGRISQQGDVRFGYGYAEADVDAVLAAFSQDNTNIATNYLQHTLSVDFAPASNVVLNATFYHYKPKDAAFAGPNAQDDWLERLRLNLLVNF